MIDSADERKTDEAMRLMYLEPHEGVWVASN